MSEQFGRIGLARELQIPLSFDNGAMKFGFTTQTEANRLAELHYNQRRAGMTVK